LSDNRVIIDFIKDIRCYRLIQYQFVPFFVALSQFVTVFHRFCPIYLQP